MQSIARLGRVIVPYSFSSSIFTLYGYSLLLEPELIIPTKNVHPLHCTVLWLQVLVPEVQRGSRW